MRALATRLGLLAVLIAALTVGVAARSAAATAPGVSLVGRLTGPDGGGLPGMRITAVPAGDPGCVPASTCPTTYSGLGGGYALAGVPDGAATIEVLDGERTLDVATVTLTGVAPLHQPLRLGPPAVPAGTVAHGAARDLRLLDAERVRDGLPGGLVLNPRWSRECAAHDAYERAHGVLSITEVPGASGASAGGAWAGLNADLAESRWSAASNPWQDAPVHLLSLLAPSLAVTGIDDGDGYQCVITSAGMVRAPGRRDHVSVVPAAGAAGVATSELARESPFTPVQFTGLPAATTTGPEILVYLNRAGELGQAPVLIRSATLRLGDVSVAVRTVDSSTPTLGPYLAGGIVIPVRPLRPHARYAASVTVSDGSATLTRSWNFRTR